MPVLVLLFTALAGFARPSVALRCDTVIPGLPTATTTVIQLDKKKICDEGFIPTAIGLLTALEDATFRYLASGDLSGTLPTEFGKLTALRTFRIGGLKVTGAIPSEIGKLTALQTLDLWSLNLWGTLPPEIGKLTALELLKVAHISNFRGTIPGSVLGKLTALKTLYFYGSKYRALDLSGTLPTDIGRLTNLELVNIFDDPRRQAKITGTLPTEIGNLVKLTDLRLSDTGLQGSLPPSIGRLTSVSKIDLSYNREISGSIPSEIGNLVKLTGLDMRYSFKIEGTLPAEIGALGKLMFMVLIQTSITGEVPPFQYPGPPVGAAGGGIVIIDTSMTKPTATNCPFGTELRNAVCVFCNKGSYSNSSSASPTGEKKCVECSGSFVAPNFGSTSCNVCIDGTEPGTGRIDCIVSKVCPKGMFGFRASGTTSGDFTGCANCPAGTFLTVPGARTRDECFPCQMGQFGSLEGAKSSDQCVKCERGKFNDKSGASVAAACKNCEPGKAYQDQEGQASCKPNICGAGQFADVASAGPADAQSPTPCLDCPAGKFSSVPGLVGEHQCTPCQAGYYSSTKGASGIEKCAACREGKFGNTSGASEAFKCYACKPGIEYTDAPGQPACKSAACRAGTFGSATQANVPPTCVGCPSGRYSSVQGLTDALDCGPCPLGRYGSSEGSTSLNSCKLCPASNTFGSNPGQADVASGCNSCPTGMFQDLPGQTSCKPASCPPGQWGSLPPDCQNCAAGKYSPAPGIGSADKCLECPSGRFGAKAGASELDGCTLCGPGSFGTAPGLISPNCSGLCPPGFHSAQAGMTGCRPCPSGYIASQIGSAECDLCPARQTTTEKGSTVCVCEASFYRVKTYNESSNRTITACVQCPTGISCNDPGSDLTDLNLDPGMWRAGPSDRDFLRCPVVEACIGGRSNTTANLTSFCLEGQHGPLCAICDPGYSRWSNTVLCSKCPDNMGPAIGGSIAAAIGLGVLLFLCLFFNRRAPNGMLRPLINAAQNLVVVMMFAVDWPESIRFFERIISGINFDFVQIASPACLGMPVSFYGRFISMIVISAAIIGIPWTWSGMRHHHNPTKWAGAVKARLRDTFLLVVLLHPTVSGLSFYHFRCRLVDDTWYLMADYSLECYDSTWYAMLVPVVLTIVGFAIGMPVLFARLLWRRRSELQNPGTKKLLGVLYLSYKPDLYWFESVTMIFKLALWATLVFFEHGSQFQLAMSAAICFAQLGVHARFEPYKENMKNMLQYLSFILVAFASFSGLLLNFVKVTVENARLSFKSAEERRLAGHEQIYKTVTAAIIWGGVVLIIFNVLISAIRFTRKHSDAIKRMGSRGWSRAAGVLVRVLSRRPRAPLADEDGAGGEEGVAAAVNQQGGSQGQQKLAVEMT